MALNRFFVICNLSKYSDGQTDKFQTSYGNNKNVNLYSFSNSSLLMARKNKSEFHLTYFNDIQFYK